jgi:hypothetical protein
MNKANFFLPTNLLAIAAFVFSAPSARCAVSAGGLAIVGYDDGADTFTSVALESIAAGEVIYFTNNGWSTSLGKFNGSSPDQGAGNESLIKLTATGTIAKGTVLSSSANGSSWAWTKTGLVPGQSVFGTGEFSDLALDYEADQIYIFQAADSDPLSHPTNFIYALHNGSADYPDFVDAQDQLTGNIPPGLSKLDHTAFAQTDFSFHGDADGNNSAWGINLSSPTISALQANGGHKADWLAAIGNAQSWSGGQTPVSGPSGVAMFTVMPEPSRPLLIGVGVWFMALRRRREGGK